MAHTHLLFWSHPFAMKLAKTTSACVLVILDLGLMELTSRNAAKEEIENDCLGASMICSTLASLENQNASADRHVDPPRL